MAETKANTNYTTQFKLLAEEIKKQGYKNICFHMTGRSLGGGSYLFYKMANYLIQNTDFTVYYTDYPDGYGSILIKNIPQIKFIPYAEEIPKLPIKEKCIIVTNSTRAIQIKNMNPENKILFWHWETIPCAWHLLFLDDETKRFLKLTKDEHAMVYHDWSAKDILNRQIKTGFNNKDYLYITIPPKNTKSNGRLINDNEINLLWLSRLGTDKVQSLYNLIKNYAAYKTDKKKRLHIIGDGVRRKEVEKFCSKYKKDIEFIFTGTILKENLDEYLINNADILFGVGTSVLEGAALKIPSVVMLMSTKPYFDKDAYWVSDTKEYCVGITTEQKKDFNIKYTSIENIINSVYTTPNGKHELGEKCFDYYIKNHSDYDRLMCEFLKFLKNTTLTFRKLHKCIKYTPYNVIKIEKYKILGLPIFKRIEHLDKIKYYFCNVEIFKKKQFKNKKKYYILGIQFQTKTATKCYTFPTARFSDADKYRNGVK